MKKITLIGSIVFAANLGLAAPVEYPKNAQVGDCFAKVKYEATYKTVEQKELVQKASFRYVDIPAKYKTVFNSVMITEPTESVVTVPAKYKDVAVRVKVADEARTVVSEPAIFTEVAENVLVQPARNVWQEGEGPHQKTAADGTVYCLVKQPAVYKTVMTKKLVKPASSKTIVTPAQYETRIRKELVQPATTKVVKTPAIYKTVPVQKLVRPASRRRLETPAQYQTVQKQVVDKPARLNWEEVLCETNLTESKMLEVQNALLAKGFSNVQANGKFDLETQAAVEKFQADNGLPVGFLTKKTLNALGLTDIL